MEEGRVRGCQSHIANDVFLSQRESAAFESARGVARCALDGSGRDTARTARMLGDASGPIVQRRADLSRVDLKK